MSEMLLHLPFESFASQAEFDAFRTQRQAECDARYLYETGMAAAAPAAHLQRLGSCSICLSATSFTTTREPAPDSSLAPLNWREGQVCGCPDRLNSRFRLLLHFITGEIAPPQFAQVLLMGAAQPIEAPLLRRVAQVAVRARSGRLLRAPRFEIAAYHLIVSSEHLHAEPDLDDVLVGLRDALLPGGTLVFTAPFDVGAARSLPPRDDRPGVLGWDILDRVARAGFAAPRAHLFWSAEFGFLGTFNLLFSARG